MRMQGYCGLQMNYFEADVARSQMFTSDVIKARNVHIKRQERDLSQIFTRCSFLHAQWGKH